MFCTKCGTQNSDTNAHCINCGAELTPPMRGYANTQQPMGGYTNTQQPMGGYTNTQQPFYGYTTTRQPLKPAGSKPIALYIVSGVIAVISFVLAFIPSFVYGSRLYNPFNFAFESFQASGIAHSSTRSASTFYSGVGVAVIILFVIPMALQIVWAVLSFMMKKPAGVFGIISSSIYFFTACFWSIITLAAVTSRGDFTPVIFFMFLFSVAGIPVSIVQLVKKKYL